MGKCGVQNAECGMMHHPFPIFIVIDAAGMVSDVKMISHKATKAQRTAKNSLVSLWLCVRFSSLFVNAVHVTCSENNRDYAD